MGNSITGIVYITDWELKKTLKKRSNTIDSQRIKETRMVSAVTGFVWKMESELKQMVKRRWNTIDCLPSKDTLARGTATSPGSRIERLVGIGCHWTNFAIFDDSTE
jgi:hypothetical protein